MESESNAGSWKYRNRGYKKKHQHASDKVWLWDITLEE